MVDELGSSMLSIRHKVVFVGNPFVGKTSLMKRIISSEFNESYDQTIGVDFYSKTVMYKETIFKLQLWDSAGQEKYKSLIPSYVRGASLIFLVYDVTDERSFDAVSTWLNFIKQNLDVNAATKLILVGNKIDLERKVNTSKAEAFAKKEGMVCYEVSAKTNQNVVELFYGGVAELDFFDDLRKVNSNILKELIEQNMGEGYDGGNNMLQMLNKSNNNVNKGKDGVGNDNSNNAYADNSQMPYTANLQIKDAQGNAVVEKRNKNKCKC
jgi:small GTP-binding protein